MYYKFVWWIMKTCSFFGHRNVQTTPKLCEELRKIVIYLIEEKGVQNFLFGSVSKFDDICLKIITELKEDYSQIRRVYVRSQYPYVDKAYKDYLLKSYDDTFMPSGIEKAGKASYVERNQAMINASDFCIFYYNKEYKPPIKKLTQKTVSGFQSKSGTRIAYEYAKQKKKEIINLYA